MSHTLARLPAGPSRFLDEAESLAVLREAGLPVVRYARCVSAADARLAFRQFGPSVAVKACAAEVPHKSEHGLVILDVGSEEAVAAAYDAVMSRLASMGIADGSVIVAPMVRGRRELALGAHVDSTFGPVVMVSDGGRYVESLPDLTLLLAPFDVDAAREAWRSLRIAPLFDGIRGEPPLDLNAACDAAVQLGDFVAAAASQIASIDLNPVLIGAAGDGAVIVDALIERASVASQRAAAQVAGAAPESQGATTENIEHI